MYILKQGKISNLYFFHVHVLLLTYRSYFPPMTETMCQLKYGPNAITIPLLCLTYSGSERIHTLILTLFAMYRAKTKTQALV